MKATHPASISVTVHRYAGVAVLLSAVLLPAGLLRADTIILKSGTGTLAVEGTIESVDAAEMVYRSVVSDREVHKAIESVLQIKAPEEPELTAAEQAYADGKWADAVTKYQSALKSSTTEWVKYRAMVRLIDAAARDNQIGPQVAGFVELARRDPANARAHRPELAGVKPEQIAAASAEVQRAANSPTVTKESAGVLREFLADLSAPDGPRAGAHAVPATAPDSPAPVVAIPVQVEGPGGAIGPHGPGVADPRVAHQIIFVCDASASMNTKAAALRDQLRGAVNELTPIQFFNIIFLRGQGCSALDETQLLSADSNNKRNADKFLDAATFSGKTDPIPGLTLAFAQHPQLIYLLTGSDFRDNKAVKDKIAELNKDHKVKINTIAFVNDQDTDTDFLNLLKEIASDNDGKFRHVAEEKLKE